jgi:predicted secreted protein
VLSTLIACEEPINSLEQEYFKALQSVSSYTLDGSTGLQLSYSSGQGRLSFVSATPAPTPTPTTQDQVCFDETGNCVGGRFLAYWRQNGGLSVFGFPLTGELNEGGRPVQYFERQRFELHAENAAPYDVQLGRLGDELLKRQGIDWFTLQKASSAPAGCRLFAETGHTVCDQPGGPSFLRYWSANGLVLDARSGAARPSRSYAESLALFGLPLTEPISATLENKMVLVQWFERARFEWHPDNPAEYRVLLGRLGAELLVAATPGNQGDQAEPADITLTNSDSGAPVSIKAGQTLAVRLDSNPSTGYVWQVRQADGAVLILQGDPQYIAPADAPPGAGGVQVFRFTAATAGQSTLTLVYRRPFEPDAAPAQTFSVQVTVE